MVIFIDENKAALFERDLLKGDDSVKITLKDEIYLLRQYTEYRPILCKTERYISNLIKNYSEDIEKLSFKIPIGPHHIPATLRRLFNNRLNFVFVNLANNPKEGWKEKLYDPKTKEFYLALYLEDMSTDTFKIKLPNFKGGDLLEEKVSQKTINKLAKAVGKFISDINYAVDTRNFSLVVEYGKIHYEYSVRESRIISLSVDGNELRLQKFLW